MTNAFCSRSVSDMGVLKTPLFDIDKTLQTQQCLKFRKAWSIDGPKYVAVVGDKLCVANQYSRKGSTFTFVMGSDDDYFDVWFDFFDLKHDYLWTDRKLRRCMGPVSYAQKMECGIHLLNVPEWQMLLESFFVSNLPRPRAAYWMEQLCAACCGVKRKNVPGLGSFIWTPVPTVEQFIDARSSGELEWYLPSGCIRKLNTFVDSYLSGGISASVFFSEKDRKMVGDWYGMSPEEFCEWFLDDEHDMLYLSVLLQTARRHGFTERF